MKPLALVRWSLDLVQLRGTPADAPPSVLLLLQLFLLNAAMTMFYRQAIGLEIAFGPMFGSMLLNLGITYLTLAAFGRKSRFVQTMIAMYSSGLLLTIILLPIAAAVVRSAGDPTDVAWQFLSLGYLSIFFWSIVVDAHILRHALALKFWYALPLALVLFMIYNQLAATLFATE